MADGFARWANPSSPHAEGRAANAALEAARGQVAAAYGWPGEVLFTSGASESLNIALTRSAVERRLASAVEHDAVLRAAYDIALVKVAADGIVDGEALNVAMQGEGRAVVAIQWCNSETGIRQPIVELAEHIHAAGHLLLVDAAQMPAGADRDVARHADFVALSAHKRGGPIGVGALLVRDLATLDPTGGQERGYRPGTENVPGVLGYAAALAEPEDVARYADLRRYLDDALTSFGGEPVLAAALRHPAIGSYRLSGMSSTTQLIRFDMAGIAVSAGSACASGQHEAEPCADRDGMESGGVAGSGTRQLRAIDDASRLRFFHRNVAKDRSWRRVGDMSAAPPMCSREGGSPVWVPAFAGTQDGGRAGLA